MTASLTITRSPGLPRTIDRMQLIPVSENLWRVVDPAGRVAGHLLSRGVGTQQCFVARRFHAPSHAFRDVGAFWTAREAIECLRLSR